MLLFQLKNYVRFDNFNYTQLILSSLQEKKIWPIVASALSFLAACYCFLHFSKPKKLQPIVSDALNPKLQKLFYDYLMNAEKNLEALYKLGECYDKGLGVEKNPKKAFEAFQKAAEKGHPIAQCSLGICYEEGEVVKQDLTAAFGWYKKSAEAGDNLAKVYLAHFYNKQKGGVKPDYEKAFELYNEAARENILDACFHLATFYADGIVVPKDMTKAVELYTKAANGGEVLSQLELGIYYKSMKDFTNSFSWFKKAAQQGDPNGQYYLGICYKNGEGVEKQLDIALEWLIKSEKGGNTKASLEIDYVKKEIALEQLNLGKQHREKKDLKTAFGCFIIATEYGNVEAQYELGICYKNGEGVEKQLDVALEWLIKSEKGGITKASLEIDYVKKQIALEQLNLGKLHREKNDLKTAFGCFIIAAEYGNVEAQYELGICYKNGEGTEINSEIALEWFTKAKDKGHEKAKQEIDQIKQGTAAANV